MLKQQNHKEITPREKTEPNLKEDTTSEPGNSNAFFWW